MDLAVPLLVVQHRQSRARKQNCSKWIEHHIMCVGVTFQQGRTLKVSMEIPATFRHRRRMTERLMKETLNQNKIKINLRTFFFFFQVEICPMDQNLMLYRAYVGPFL